ncbi:MAG: azurin [Lautropia sp.]|nr:azurin [Lautropia sp.]
MLAKALLVGMLAVASGSVAAKTCDVTVEGTDAMTFNTKEIKVDGDCTEVNLTLKHVGKIPASAMGHNVVITKTADYKAVAKAGGKLTAADNYVPKDDKVLAFTKIIGGGESTDVKIDMSKFKAGEDYTFFCSFPGHWSVMKGKFVFGS